MKSTTAMNPSPDARPSRSATRVPGISLREQVEGMRAMRKNQVDYLARMIAVYGDVVRIRAFGVNMIVLNHPDHFERVLVRNHENYDKNTLLFRAVEPILRGGLIGAVGGEPWRRRRRIMQPAFHRPQVAGFAKNMTDETGLMVRRWEREYSEDDAIDVCNELGQLVLRIVFRTLFGAEVGEGGEEIESIFVEGNQIMGQFFQLPFPPLTWPTPRNRRLRQIIGIMDGYVDEVIRRRDEEGEEHHDLLTLLVDGVDEETGIGMTPVQLHREVLNTIIGGYETSSNAIAWLIYLVGTHPHVQERLQAEVDGVLGGRVPTFDDLQRLQYTRMVVDEMLRLYTPAFQTMRRSIEADEIGGYHIPRKSNIYLNIYALHRHPDFWPSPDAFDPERFSPEQVAQRPRHAFVPFGSGPRNCIGKHFALTELTLVLAMLAQAFRMEIPEEHREVQFEPLITLRPKGGIYARMRRR
ncbi:cytochrome P450 [Streptosporangium algeriense]|uniref:Cytochrome P450 n=1 Tax=Streptosporangium algeriense TaxID=1682748 RepID=A0ABW3DTE6_9ACTN